MNAVQYDSSQRVLKELRLAYRTIVTDPPYDAMDRRLLSVAASRHRVEWVRPLVHAAAALLMVAFGLVTVFGIAVRSGSQWPRPIAEVSHVIRSWTGLPGRPAVSLPSKVALYQVASSHPVPGAQAHPAGSAAGSAGDRISDFLVEPLKAAQAAQRAAMDARLAHDSQREAEELQVEIQELEVAEASGGKTAYDEYLIDSWLSVAYVNVHDFAKAVPYMQAVASSQYATPRQRKAMQQAASTILSRLSGKAGKP